MKLSLKTIVEVKPSLKKLIAQDLPIKISYKIIKIHKMLQCEN